MDSHLKFIRVWERIHSIALLSKQSSQLHTLYSAHSVTLSSDIEEFQPGRALERQEYLLILKMPAREDITSQQTKDEA